jgi:multiple antibiotic resistance protein
MEHLVTFAVAMLTITNPIGALAIFAGMTADRPDSEKKESAFKAAFAVAVILLIVTWAGKYVLEIFGITPPGLEVAGGVIIALMGLSMLHSKTSAMSHTKAEGDAAAASPSIAVVPMAMPIIAGPGGITTVILATHKFPSIEEKLLVSATCVAVAVIIWLCLYFAAPISRMLGVAGMNIVTRIMGIVLTVIAFQMLTAGLKTLLPGRA